MAKADVKKKVIKGDKLKELRAKIITVADVHTKDTPADIANKISVCFDPKLCCRDVSTPVVIAPLRQQ